MGVFHPDLVGIQVRALQRLGAEHAVVVYGRDGMDEISLGAATMVGELKDGEIREYEIHPEDFGFTMSSNRGAARRDAGAVEGDARARCSPTSRARRATSSLLNAGAALYAANVAPIDRRGRGARARGARRRRGAGQARRVRRLRAGRGELEASMSDILEQIVAVKREEVAAAQERARGLAALRADAEALGGRATSSAALRAAHRRAAARR